MNGFQLCKNIRSDSLLEDIPIVLITSKGKDVGQGFDEKFGIARYLQKPFENDVLIKTVKEVLPVREEESEAISETDSQAPLQTDALPKDVPSLENTSTEVTPSGDQPMETLPSDTSFAGTPEAELPAPEKEPATPVYANLLENVEKEIRYYFGQELAVLLKSTVVQALKETDLVRSSRRILTGEVTYISVADILQLISMSSLSGKLSVLTNNFNSEIYLDNGLIAFASISKPGYRTCLEELIVKDGKIRRSDIRSVFSEARGSNLAAGAILLERGLITEDELTDYYRLLSEDAVHQTLSAASGHFYIEDVPLPREIQSIKLRIPSNGARR
jgi:CheY-like chemotaxis protein